MNILINNNENYQPQMVMNKINSRKSIKGFIYIHLNISVKEFPLKNYILEEINEDIPDYTKTFLLKKKDQNQNTNPNPLYDNRNTNIIKFNPINNQIQTKVINNNSTTLNNNNNNNNSISSNNGINNYNNIKINLTKILIIIFKTINRIIFRILIIVTLILIIIIILIALIQIQVQILVLINYKIILINQIIITKINS